ncbi:uncharacterized protein LOC124306252 [Neodiprion virginianus]|uniref:uncharacterized protein LOC124306252 n=1 Tax=Neodiprion virginianus TaxID=2961670 RepID=UPI001EE7498B|nr:uncharacterized protein LOC124306252 [Neodiprion virginianus]
MKRLASLLLIVILTTEYASAVTVVRERDGSMESSNGINGRVADHVGQLINGVERLPYIGEIVKNFLTQAINIVIQLDVATKGNLSRMINRIMPCTISVDGSMMCSGVSMASQIRELVTSLIDIFLPPWAKIVLATVIARMKPMNFTDNW